MGRGACKWKHIELLMSSTQVNLIKVWKIFGAICDGVRSPRSLSAVVRRKKKKEANCNSVTIKEQQQNKKTPNLKTNKPLKYFGG